MQLTNRWRAVGFALGLWAAEMAWPFWGRHHRAAHAGELSPTKVQFVNNSSKTLRHWPVVVSVPLARDSKPATKAVGLLSSGERAWPTTSQVLARWETGSPRWVRIYGQADFKAGQATQAIVRNVGEGLKGFAGLEGPVQTRELPDRLEVRNGEIHFVIRQRSDAWIDSLWWDKRKGGGIRIVGEAQVDGEVGHAGPIESIEVLDSGPLRALVEVRGRYGTTPLHYRLRIECFAHQPILRMFHTFEVHAATPTVYLERLAIHVSLPKLTSPNLLYRVDGQVTPVQARLPFRIVQQDNEKYLLGSDPHPGRLAGWFDVHDAKFGLTLWARWFWQQYPQAIQVKSQRLTYEVFGGDRPALAGTGAAKTHEFVLALRGGGEAAGLDELVHFPLEGRVDPKWLAESGALRGANLVGTEAGQAFFRRLLQQWSRVEQRYEVDEWDDRQSVHCPEGNGPDPFELRRRGFFGMWNWGDWNYPGYHDTTKGCDAWGNLEYDLTQVSALACWLTGNARLCEATVAAGRHFMDVDIIHYHPRYPQWVGMNHPKAPLHWSLELGGVDLGHTWTEGLLSLYLLTGDDNALVAARGIGEFLLRRVRAPLKGNPRQFGWPQIALVALYEVTNDQRFLNGAKEYARLGMERHHSDKIQDWKLGVLAEGLAYTHRYTGDEQIRTWLERYAKAVLTTPSATDARLWPAVAYVASLRGDRAAADKARAVVDRLDFGGWAKPFTIAGRVGFAILSNLGTLAEADRASSREASPLPTKASKTTPHPQ